MSQVHLFSKTKFGAAELLVKKLRSKGQENHEYGLICDKRFQSYKILHKNSSGGEHQHSIAFKVKTKDGEKKYRAIYVIKTKYKMIIHPGNDEYFTGYDPEYDPEFR